jgi:hypothetical protein
MASLDRIGLKYSLFVSGFNETFILLDRFSKNIHIPNFMKIRQVGVEPFHADRHDEASNRFLHAKATKNGREQRWKIKYK